MDCNLCDREALGKCSSCGIARYCSQDCMDMDWHEHKACCFDRSNPDEDRLDMLVDACLDRNVQEWSDESSDVSFEDVNDKVNWLTEELEYPHINKGLKSKGRGRKRGRRRGKKKGRKKGKNKNKKQKRKQKRRDKKRRRRRKRKDKKERRKDKKNRDNGDNSQTVAEMGDGDGGQESYSERFRRKTRNMRRSKSNKANQRGARDSSLGALDRQSDSTKFWQFGKRRRIKKAKKLVV